MIEKKKRRDSQLKLPTNLFTFTFVRSHSPFWFSLAVTFGIITVIKFYSIPYASSALSSNMTTSSLIVVWLQLKFYRLLGTIVETRNQQCRVFQQQANIMDVQVLLEVVVGLANAQSQVVPSSQSELIQCWRSSSTSSTSWHSICVISCSNTLDFNKLEAINLFHSKTIGALEPKFNLDEAALRTFLEGMIPNLQLRWHVDCNSRSSPNSGLIGSSIAGVGRHFISNKSWWKVARHIYSINEVTL